jgi:hypothetical protein
MLSEPETHAAQKKATMIASKNFMRTSSSQSESDWPLAVQWGPS